MMASASAWAAVLAEAAAATALAAALTVSPKTSSRSATAAAFVAEICSTLTRRSVISVTAIRVGLSGDRSPAISPGAVYGPRTRRSLGADAWAVQ